MCKLIKLGWVAVVLLVQTGCNLSWGTATTNITPSGSGNSSKTPTPTSLAIQATSNQVIVTTWTQRRAPEFADFPVTGAIFQGTPVQPDLASHPAGATFPTRLHTEAAKGPNFGGHFTVVEIGCGTACAAHYLVYAADGKIYGAIATQRGVQYKLDSNLYIADPPYPPDVIIYSDDPNVTLPVRYYVWNGKALQLIYQAPCSVKDGKQIC